MASLEQAISVLFDPMQPQHIKASAMELTESAKQDPVFYKFAMQKILEVNLDLPNSVNYLFWYLQALEELLNRSYCQFPPQAHCEVQAFLQMIIDSRLDIIEKHYGLLNKFALLYVRVVQVDFPEQWEQAFQLPLERASLSAVHAKLFLSVMKIFSEEFVEELGYKSQEQLRRSNILKDAIKEKVLGAAATIWKQLLESGEPNMTTATLQVMVPYITWVPLELSMGFFGYFLNFLARTETQIPALQCIDSLVNKKMDPARKLGVIRDLNLVNFIQGFSFDNFDMLSDIPKTMASLIDSLGENLLDSEIGNEFQAVLECSLKCLANVIYI